MTQWLARTSGGRDRGPRALARAWVEALVRPRRFFRAGVAPGDQAPGLTFAMAVVLVEEASRMALVPDAVGPIGGSRLLASVLAVAVAVLLVVPAALHLIAGLQTVLLLPLAGDRGGVSETVQVVAYATAPCALVGPAIPELRLAGAAYGFGLFVVGLSVVHDLPTGRAFLAGAVPGALVFGYGFRGFGALGALLSRWYII